MLKLEGPAEFIRSRLWSIFCAESRRYWLKALSSNRHASLFLWWRKRFAACRLTSAFGKDWSFTKHNRGGW